LEPISFQKKIKTLFRKWDISEHWHLDETDIVIDTFKSLTKHLRADLVHFFNELLIRKKDRPSVFKNNWQEKNQKCKLSHDIYLSNAPWSDLNAYAICLDQLPQNSMLQMANSTAVRYVQLMEKREDISYFSNRGVAGIDGCTSTAVGASWAHDKQTVLVTGDIAFFYDSNALWLPYLSKKLRIIVFNNEGGNIFRFIPGPDSTNQLEKFFETHHDKKAEHLARAYDLHYFKAENKDDLLSILPDFFSNNNSKACLLEIFTPRKENAGILKAYFRELG